MGCLAVAPSAADVAFAKLDLDGDGHISRDEFAELYVDYFTTEDPEAPARYFWGPMT
jgi:Ca2+-binding EF-hand superfamily protein